MKLHGSVAQIGGAGIVAALSLTWIAFAPAFAQTPESQPPAEAAESQRAPEPSPLDAVAWQAGPSSADLGDIATVGVPEGFVFAGAEDTRTILEYFGNPTYGSELGLLAPGSLDWFAVFEFDDVGFVSDNEKNDLDADALLKSIQEGTEESNKEREKRGWSRLHIVGWLQPPRYNEKTHNLEWATKGEVENGGGVINFNTRLLGRRGVMRVDLVTDPEDFEGVLPIFAEMLDQYQFKAGHTYAEYREGDKIAQYGLAALITGGAVAVAAKSGFLKWIWKILVIAALAVGGLLKKLFSGRSASKYPAE